MTELEALLEAEGKQVEHEKKHYLALPNTENANASDLYLNGELVHSNVPDELLQPVENYVVKIGRDFKVFVGKGKFVNIAAGSVLLKVVARPEFPQYLVVADNSVPAFWIGRNSADKHYRSNEPRTVIIK